MPFELRKRFTFEAAHKLPNHDGKCRRLHGHSWILVVVVRGGTLHDEGPKQGMLMDFSDISRIVKPFVDEYLDHQYLNDTVPVANPTSEEIARWCYEELAPRFHGDLVSVSVEETATSSCGYSE